MIFIDIIIHHVYLKSKTKSFSILRIKYQRVIYALCYETDFQIQTHFYTDNFNLDGNLTIIEFKNMNGKLIEILIIYDNTILNVIERRYFIYKKVLFIIFKMI